MNQGLMFYPCLALIALTFIALVTMFKARQAALKSGDISAGYFKTYDNGEKLPRKARQAERLFHNLQESTPIFYFLCAATMALGLVDSAFLGLAWAYVVLRTLQSVVHLTTNKLQARASLYGVSWIVMLAIAIKLAVEI
jgi:hypothetical protein